MSATAAVKRQRGSTEFAGLSDEDVMRAVQAGSVSAGSELVRRFSNRMYRLAWRTVHSDEDAEDVVQTAWLKVFSRAQQFQFRSKVGTWLYRITFTEALLLLRRRPSRLSRRVESLERFSKQNPDHRALVCDRGQEPDQLLQKRELWMAVEQAASKLEKLQRQPFLLCVLGGMSPKTCAIVLDISYPAVKSRIHQARLAIQRQLQEHLTGRVAKSRKV
ncbi:MAG: RNA polymerase sigma factor [Candidatus Kerfeldbacteria bacterium]|nr:RNA polymerase sigma factor [Candidatus Kerfeldbacteria bacterium]